MPNESELLSIGEAAKCLPFTEASLRAKINAGQVTVVRIADRIFILSEELVRAFGDLYRPRFK